MLWIENGADFVYFQIRLDAYLELPEFVDWVGSVAEAADPLLSCTRCTYVHCVT